MEIAATAGERRAGTEEGRGVGWRRRRRPLGGGAEEGHGEQKEVALEAVRERRKERKTVRAERFSCVWNFSLTS